MFPPATAATSGVLLALSVGLAAPHPSHAALAEPPRLVADIDRQPTAAGLDAALDFVALGPRAVFFATDADHGREPWVSDGTAAGTLVLADICPGPCDGGVVPWHVSEGGLLFFLRGAAGGRTEIWRTDGTTAGTLRLASHSFADVLGELPDRGLLIWAGASTGPVPSSRLWVSDGTVEGTRSYFDLRRAEAGLVELEIRLAGPALGDRLLLVVREAGVGDEPWVTDGTAAGTHLLKDVHPGAGSSLPRAFVALDGTALFHAGDPTAGHELWRTDGTAAGTRRVADLTPGPVSTNLLGEPAGAGDRAFFVAEQGPGGAAQLWVSDGTALGTRQLTGFAHSGAFGEPRDLDHTRLQVVDGRLFFVADDGASGAEAWTSDGTPGGTRRIADLCPGPCASSPAFAPEHPEGTILLRAREASGVSTLFATDGTASDPRRLVDPCPGACPQGPHAFTARGGEAFFAAQVASGGPVHLWITDGTPGGTERLTAFGPGDFGLQSVSTARALAGTTLLFTAHTAGHGTRVWRSDGTRAGTVPLEGVGVRSSGGSDPREIVASGGRALFFADDGLSGRELWTSDGTAAGTSLVREVIPGVGLPGPTRLRDLTPVAGGVVFLAEPAPPPSGRAWELWTSDGTPAGTTRLDLGGAPVSDRGGFGRLGGAVLFFAEGLWRSDGTPGGTTRVAGLHAPAPVAPRFDGPFFARLGDRLLLVGADGPGLPPVLWSTDGTPGGTRPVLGPPALTLPQQLVAAGGRVVFVARDPEHGLEPWITDGTAAGTRRIADLRAGDAGSAPQDLVAVGSQVYFTAEAPLRGRGLWVTDGTAEGTQSLRDLPGVPPFAEVEEPTAFGGRLAFTAVGAGRGRELWTSDGTAEGTAPVLDLWPGPAGSDPGELAVLVLGGSLFFSAGTRERGRELWVTDGTAAGTVPVPDVAPGTASSSPAGMAAVGGSVLFAASDGVRGRELWALDLAVGPGGDPPPPDGPWLTSPRVPGFRFQVRIDQGGGAALAGAPEPACIPETLCVSGAVPGRSEVFLRVVGPKPNGRLWPTLVKFTTSAVEVWIEQIATGDLRYYRLAGARPGLDELPGLFDRDGFRP